MSTLDKLIRDGWKNSDRQTRIQGVVDLVIGVAIGLIVVGYLAWVFWVSATLTEIK